MSGLNDGECESGARQAESLEKHEILDVGHLTPKPQLGE